jgi:hypothetical protein
MTVYHKPSSFVIDRNIWFRGKPGACLLDNNGQRCCVGILAQACGIPDEKLKGRNKIYSTNISPEEILWAYLDNDDIFQMAYLENDTQDYTDETLREAAIQKWFKEKLDIEVSFIN